ncbi:hypothetical protein [Marilutibacter chinensis]|uniref:Uncharacterized protein n=1 Tax=Marilutibacter chinensis TaxID=2912247 RepID=A0ABS9HUN0_9GAMM|nr:hypothetical protein [Lysobacter chinensis]MCF7221867.1 hypothetical protein [Lysobacter chinensis]
MSREDFIAVATRLFAVYILFVTIGNIPGMVVGISQPGGGTWFWLYLLVAAFALCIIGLLWFFPLTVARKLLPVMREPRSEQALDASTAFSIGITLIGLWFLATGLADGVYWLTFWFRLGQMDVVDVELLGEHVAGMAATGAQLLIAMVLMLGSGGIRRLIYRYRYGRLDDYAGGSDHPQRPAEVSGERDGSGRSDG